VIGDFVAVAAAMKGMPSTYNLDFQEVTPKLWEAVESVQSSLKILAELVLNLKVQSDVSEKGLKSFVAATELANMLVRKYSIPFRSAHKIVGSLVKLLIESKRTFKDATPELLQKVAQDNIGITLSIKAEDIAESVDPKKIVESYKVTGGPAPTEVSRALVARKKSLAEAKSNINKLKQALEDAEKKLDSTTKFISKADSEQNGRFKNSKR
jgi:argininosuccinate lyase